MIYYYITALGPDEILMSIEGSSLQTQIALTTDFCSNYYAIFQIPISGSYR